MSYDHRLTEIETRLAFQEYTLNELSDLIHQQKKELDALRKILAHTSADLRELRDGLPIDTLPEPPPPHY